MRKTLLTASLMLAVGLPLLAQPVRKSSDVSIGDPLSLTFYLQPRNLAAAEAEAIAVQTPGSSSYHRFLTVPQFADKYGATDKQIDKVIDRLRRRGFTVSYVFPNHLALQATATAGVASQAFGVKLKRLTLNGRTGIAPTSPVSMPDEIKEFVRGVGGLDTLTHAHPMHVADHAKSRPVPAVLTGGKPGSLLPSDFAANYNMAPLYRKGFNGRGSTIGIVTLNGFNESDAYLFWKSIGLEVAQSRITQISVDGGLDQENDPDGEAETDLDVQQSGALAPAADLRVYVAPNNTAANFIDAFQAAASENIADTVSTSWGESEIYYFQNLATQSASQTFVLDAFHDVFLEMALQGQTVYVASGDRGAFDTEKDCSIYGSGTPDVPVCNTPYSVDHPSSDPLVTAAGGTSLPFTQVLSDGVVLSVKREQPWSWSYLASESAAQGSQDVKLGEVFSIGGGGGVSSYFPQPAYQSFVKGINLTMTGQDFTVDTGSGPQVWYQLPGNFAGRNTPDISTNADPKMGYGYIQGGELQTGHGGTSFVAPQLNGVTALFVQALGHRVGQINPTLYRMGDAATTDLISGDNWGYEAAIGYDNASGLGALDGYQLFQALSMDAITNPISQRPVRR